MKIHISHITHIWCPYRINVLSSLRSKSVQFFSFFVAALVYWIGLLVLYVAKCGLKVSFFSLAILLKLLKLNLFSYMVSIVHDINEREIRAATLSFMAVDFCCSLSSFRVALKLEFFRYSIFDWRSFVLFVIGHFTSLIFGRTMTLIAG